MAQPRTDMHAVPGAGKAKAERLVVVLDDDEGLARLVAKRLKQKTLRVETFTDPAEALAWPEVGMADVFLLDYQLGGGMTGLDFYLKVREKGRVETPAVLVTGFADERVLSVALRLGVRDFLPKNSEFLENLPLVVERVLLDSERQRELEQSEAARTIQSATKAAMEAAGSYYFALDFESREGTFSEGIMELFGAARPPADDQIFRAVIRSLPRAGRQQLLKSLRHARGGDGHFEVELSIENAGSRRWLRIKGRSEYEGRHLAAVTGIVWDETIRHEWQAQLERSRDEIEQLAQRLKLSMLETHHRVKNSFQIVRSLLNMEMRSKSVLTKDDVMKVSSHVQGLAVIHDILTDQIKSGRVEHGIDAAELVERLASILGVSKEGMSLKIETVKAEVSPRVASSLAVIATELLINALKYSNKHVGVKIALGESGLGTLSVSNDVGTPGQDDVGGGTGRSLVEFLAKADFQRDVRFTRGENDYVVSVDFPLLSESSS